MQVATSIAKKKMMGKVSQHTEPKRPAYETDPDLIAAMEEASKTQKKSWWKRNKAIKPEIILSKEDQDVLRKVRNQAWRMDKGVSCCGFNVGLDPIIGLIPGIGDVITSFMALYLVKTASAANLPTSLLAHMTWNVMLDFVLGLTPIAGDILDFLFKANIRNAALLEEYLFKRRLDEIRAERGEGTGFSNTFKRITGNKSEKAAVANPDAVTGGGRTIQTGEKALPQPPKNQPTTAVEIEHTQPQTANVTDDAVKKKRFGFF